VILADAYRAVKVRGVSHEDTLIALLDARDAGPVTLRDGSTLYYDADWRITEKEN
jgi:hypothetical protein